MRTYSHSINEDGTVTVRSSDYPGDGFIHTFYGEGALKKALERIRIAEQANRRIEENLAALKKK